MKFEAVIPLPRIFNNLRCLQKHVVIQFLDLLQRYSIFLRVKVVQITDDVAEGVADLAVILCHALHQLFRADHVFAEVHGGDPQTHDFSAEAISDVHRINVVAPRLGHRSAFFVEGPAVGHHHAVGRSSPRAHGAEQRRMEPSAVLVAAFEIEISREGQVRFLAKDGGIARAGLEPDIDDVGFFPEFCSAALGALAANRKPIGFWRIPRVRAGAGKELDHSAVHLGIAQGLAATFT